jgi:isopenicillin N synthase-like dioxygenase
LCVCVRVHTFTIFHFVSLTIFSSEKPTVSFDLSPCSNRTDRCFLLRCFFLSSLFVMVSATPTSVLEVPVVDIGALIALPDDASVAAALREDNPVFRDVIAAVRDAAAEWGFFYIENHGLDEKYLAHLWATARAFFALPKDVRDSIRRTEDNPLGYFDSELTKNKLDAKEVFDFAGRQLDGPRDDSVYERLGGEQNQWLDEDVLPGFRATVQTHFSEAEHIARRLIQVFAVALGERFDFFDQFFHQEVQQTDATGARVSNNSGLVRLNHYPVVSEPEKTMGVYHHTDPGAVTILLQDDEVASLQVFHRGEQQWHNVPPRKGTFVVNIGDMVQLWSNDKFVAPEHRVLASSSKGRFSVPFFYNPSYSAVVKPIVVREGEKPHYRPVTWREFLLSRAKGNYADLGEEIQLNQFKLEQ